MAAVAEAKETKARAKEEAKIIGGQAKTDAKEKAKARATAMERAEAKAEVSQGIDYKVYA